MVTITELHSYSKSKNNADWIAACEKYIQETKSNWSNGKYYFGGQIPLNINNHITEQIIQDATNKNKKSMENVYDSFEMGSIHQHLKQFHTMLQIIESYTNEKSYFTEDELNLHKQLV